MKQKIWFLVLLVIAVSIVCAMTMIFYRGVSLSAPSGADLYAAHCGGCHANGGNVINPALPVAGSAKMKSLAAFTAFNRNPLKADGNKGIMPAFGKDKISDAEMKLIYEYALKLPGTKK